MANLLHRRLDRKTWTITVIDKDADHYGQPGFLFPRWTPSSTSVSFTR